ncbi:MAG TPA: hypothetical protein VJI33_03675 [Candidatus Paceibacterota bacterium]
MDVYNSHNPEGKLLGAWQAEISWGSMILVCFGMYVPTDESERTKQK